jgi:two-component SAPR family response regulator
VREILFYLLAHPDGVTRENVGVVFWPDSSPSQLRLQFGNTVYRLRRALMKEVVLFDPDEERYYFNRQLDYEYDVEKFQQEVERSQATVSPEEQVASYQAAIDLYRGFYLPGLDGTWIWTEREGLEQAYITANLKLAEFYLERSDYNLVLKYCRQVLTVDLFQEEAHRYAMRAHAALGNRAAVIRQFEQCQQVLLAEIDAPVSPQTRELYETLTR